MIGLAGAGRAAPLELDQRIADVETQRGRAEGIVEQADGLLVGLAELYLDPGEALDRLVAAVEVEGQAATAGILFLDPHLGDIARSEAEAEPRLLLFLAR